MKIGKLKNKISGLFSKNLVVMSAICAISAISSSSYGSWTPPVSLSSGPNGGTADLDMNNLGVGAAIWLEQGASEEVKVAFFNGTSWGAPTPLSTTSVSSGSPSIALNDAGAAVAVWSEFDGSNFIAYGAVYDGSSWSSSTQLSTSGENAVEIIADIDSAGNAVVVWNRNFIIQAATYDASLLTWDLSIPDLSSNTGSAVAADFVMHPNGNAIVVWSFNDVLGNSIQASIYDGSIFNLTTSLVVTSEVLDAPSCDINASGDAVVAWYGQSLGLDEVHAVFYTGGTWQTTNDFSPVHSGGATDPQINMNNAGNAMITWQGYDSFYSHFVVSAAYYNGSSWGSTSIISPIGEDSTNPKLTFNSVNEAFVNWSGYDGSDYSIKSIEFVGLGWASPTLLETSTAGPIDITMAHSGVGTALATWTYYNGIDYIIRAAHGSF